MVNEISDEIRKYSNVSANNYAWQVATHPATKSTHTWSLPDITIATQQYDPNHLSGWLLHPEELKPIEPENTPEEVKIDYMKAVRDMCK